MKENINTCTDNTYSKEVSILHTKLAGMLLAEGFKLKYIRKNRNNPFLKVFYFIDCPEIRHYIDLFKNNLLDIEVKIVQKVAV
jgi:hypothetical protein